MTLAPSFRPLAFQCPLWHIDLNGRVAGPRISDDRAIPAACAQQPRADYQETRISMDLELLLQTNVELWEADRDL